MSRSNLDKPFYVDVGTSIVAVRCASNHDVIFEYDHSWRPSSIELAKTACDRMNREVEIHNSGNAAKMYEALCEIAKRIENICGSDECDDREISKIGALIKQTLAETPRNCDVGTAEEQQARHYAWCRKHGINGDNKVNCAHPDMYCDLCTLRWAQMPYEEGGDK